MTHRSRLQPLRLVLLSLALIAASTFIVGAQSSQPRAAEAGWAALEDGDGERAANAFRLALADRPRDPALLFGAGAAAHLTGRDREAHDLLRRALDIEPRLTPASILLGRVTYDLGDVSAAIRVYEEALVHAPHQRQIRDQLTAWRGEASKTTYNSGPYSIMFEGHTEERLAAHATQVLDAGYWRIGKTIGAYPSVPITVILYTEQEFHDVTGAPEWSDGSFDTRIRIPVRGALRTGARFDRVLTHELAHAMIASLAARGVPAWLHEGLAVNLEPGDVDGAEQRPAGRLRPVQRRPGAGRLRRQRRRGTSGPRPSWHSRRAASDRARTRHRVRRRGEIVGSGLERSRGRAVAPHQRRARVTITGASLIVRATPLFVRATPLFVLIVR
jgi:hypothetical protein